MYATATVIVETLGYKVKNAWNPHTRPPPPSGEKKRLKGKIKEASPASVILQTDADTQTSSNKYANMYLNGSLIGLTWLL